MTSSLLVVITTFNIEEKAKGRASFFLVKLESDL